MVAILFDWIGHRLREDIVASVSCLRASETRGPVHGSIAIDRRTADRSIIVVQSGSPATDYRRKLTGPPRTSEVTPIAQVREVGEI